MNRIFLYPLLFSVCLALSAPAFCAPLPQKTVVIRSGQHTHRLALEIAQTPEEQEHGLMFRKSLPFNHGMLFLFPGDDDTAMWMKDTLIPLDMLFIDRNGRIVYIARNTTPGSLEHIQAGRPVRAVIELGGGVADKDHIQAGDRVMYRFDTNNSLRP